MDLSAITRPLVYSILVMPLLAVAVAILFRHQHRLINFSTVLFSFLSLLASLYVAPVFIDRPDHYLWDLMYLDSLSIYFVLLVNLVAFFASIYTIPFLRHDRERNKHHDPGWFHVFLNLFHVTMLVVPMVNNLVILWIAIELTTIFSTVLVRYQRSRLAIEASWKFMIITTTGIIFALLGTLFLVNSASEGLVDRHMAMNWSELANPRVAEKLNSNFVMLSFLFIMIGYGTKAGLAPMHTWLPDGHGEAPPPVSALLSGVMLKSALYAVLRFYTITNLNLGSTNFTSILLMAFGLFSLTVATPFILKKNKFKRVLAYHSLEHMGIITFGIGVGTPLALLGALLHTLNHALTKALMFLVYGNIQYEHIKRCDDGSGTVDEEVTIRGVLRSMPFSGTLLGFGGLALVGSPPFSIFMSEFVILWAAIQKLLLPNTDQTIYTKVLQAGAILLFVVTVTVIFGGLVNHLSKLLLGKSPIPTLEPVLTPTSVALGVPFLALIAILLLFGILIPTWPIDLPKLLVKAVEILRYGIRSAS
jgi:hydrogenase-4 component F